MITFCDNEFSCTQASLDDDIISYFRTNFYETSLNGGVCPEHINICAAFFNIDRFERDDISVFPNVEEKFHFGKLSRQQSPVGIRHLGTYREGACKSVDFRSGEIN